MAKTSYLNLTNKLLRRINQNVITDVVTATGDALIITNLINEAQLELYNQENWYSLHTSRTVATVAGTSTYTLASDFGRSISLDDTTNNRHLTEDWVKTIDVADPDLDREGNPTHFAIHGDSYILYPTPNGVFSLRDRYWKIPADLVANTHTSHLPMEAENCIIFWAWYMVLEYKERFNAADRVRIRYEQLLKDAKKANRKILTKMNIMGGGGMSDALAPPKFPSTYGYRI